MKILGLTFFLLLLFPVEGQKDPALLRIGIDNTSKKKLTVEQIDELNYLINDTVYGDAKTGAKYSHLALRESKRIEYDKGQINALHQLCKAMYYSNESDSALFYAKYALKIAEKIKDGKLQVQSHNVIAGILSLQGHHDLAADEYFLTIQLAEKHDPSKIAMGYANLGHIFKMINNLPKCREYSQKAYDQAKKQKDTSIMIMTSNLLGLVDHHEQKHQSAISHFNEGMELAKIRHDIQRESQLAFNLANTYFDIKEYKKGFELYYYAIDITKGYEGYHSTAISFHGLAEAYFDVRQMKLAKQFADSALHYSLLSESFDVIMESYNLLANIAKEEKKYFDAYTYLTSAFAYKDSMNLSQLNAAALDAEDQFNKKKERMKDSLLQVQHELEVSNERKVNDQKIKTRDTLIWLIGIVLILVTLGIYLLYKNMKEVQRQKDLVSHQKEEIQEQHNEIKDSINYAKRIQDAVISKAAGFDKISDDNFVMFLPKNVVSGDFYWSHTFENGNSIWAVGDCTGHGVPGAFMSLLGIGFLNEIVIENGTTDPGAILDQLRLKIIQAIEQKDEVSSTDGMDIGVCFFDKLSNKLKYAGANNALWVIKTSAIEESNHIKLFNPNADKFCLYEILPDKMPIGKYFKTPPPFTTKEITLESGDEVILLSDGYADQFGGPNGKKFKYSPLKQLLLDTASLKMEEVNSKLISTFEEWKGKEEQVDDICLVGIRIQ